MSKKRKAYTPEFKLEVVLEGLRGDKSIDHNSSVDLDSIAQDGADVQPADRKNNEASKRPLKKRAR